MGRFLLQQELGEGGMGTVFEAVDTILDRRVALKFLRPGKMDPELLFRGSLRESRVLAELNHQNIVHLYDVGMHDRRPYFVMELVRGKSLRVLCNAFGTLETFDALGVSVQIGEGLCAAHGAGIIHNDLKPENVMMTANPAGHVKLVDFGLSRTVERASTGTTGELIDGKGTPHYMAPELHRGDRATPQSDVYSWGQITHEMLTGRFLFERRTGDVPSRREVGRLHLTELPISIVEIRGESLAEVERIVFRMLAKRPDDRPTSREALRMLQRELARLEVELPLLSDRALTAEVSRPPIVQVVSPVAEEDAGPRTEPQGTARGRIATVRMGPAPVEEKALERVSERASAPSSEGVSGRASVPSSERVSSRVPVPSRVSENLRRVLTTQIGSVTRTSVAASEGASVEVEMPRDPKLGRASWMVRDLDTGEYRRLSYMSTEPLEPARDTRSSDRGGWTSSPAPTAELPTPTPAPTPTATAAAPRLAATVTERIPVRPQRPRSGHAHLWVGVLVGLTSAVAAFAVYLLAPAPARTGASSSGASVGTTGVPAVTAPEAGPMQEDAGAADAAEANDASATDAGATDSGVTPSQQDDAGTTATETPPKPAAGSTTKRPASASPGASPPGGRKSPDGLPWDIIFEIKKTPSSPSGGSATAKPPKPASSGKSPPAAPTSTTILPFGKGEP
ncbi:MAG: protein kinase [Polyangiaceae bacterium]